MARPNGVPIAAPEYDALRDALIVYGAPAVFIALSDIAKVIGDTIDSTQVARWERSSILSDIVARYLAATW